MCTLINTGLLAVAFEPNRLILVKKEKKIFLLLSEGLTSHQQVESHGDTCHRKTEEVRVKTHDPCLTR